MTEPGVALVIAPATEAKANVPARAYTEILFLPPHNVRLERFTGPKLGAENPDAPKITGFDRVEDMSKLPEELFKILGNGRPVVLYRCRFRWRDSQPARSRSPFFAERMPF